MPHYIASVSWGKDSLAMLHLLIDSEWPLDEIAEPRKSPRSAKTAQTGIDDSEDPK